MLVALSAVLLAFSWQFLTVHFNYGGNWTALFRIAADWPRPGAIATEHLYLDRPGGGYDGEFFHIIAHDPWMNAQSAAAIDAPAMRYGRILVPLLAWALAFGNDAFIHVTYELVILAFVFLGAYWLSRLAIRAGRGSLWGLMFVVMPATITSVDAMVCDVALSALALGFALYSDLSEQWKVYLVVFLAALTRETALPMIAGYGLYLLIRRRYKHAALTALATLPAICWLVFVRRNEGHGEVAMFLGWIPMGGYLTRLGHPRQFDLPPLQSAIALIVDYAALIGAGAAFVMVAFLAWRRRIDERMAATYGLAVFFLFLRYEEEWLAPYGYGRVLTPLLLLVALQFMPKRPWLAFAPALAISARLGLNLVVQMTGVLHGILG